MGRLPTNLYQEELRSEARSAGVSRRLPGGKAEEHGPEAQAFSPEEEGKRKKSRLHINMMLKCRGDCIPRKRGGGAAELSLALRCHSRKEKAKTRRHFAGARRGSKVRDGSSSRRKRKKKKG